jgi:hypothetical protein
MLVISDLLVLFVALVLSADASEGENWTTARPLTPKQVKPGGLGRWVQAKGNASNRINDTDRSFTSRRFRSGFNSLMSRLSVKDVVINNPGADSYYEDAIKAISGKQPMRLYEGYFSIVPQGMSPTEIFTAIDGLESKERSTAIATVMLAYLYRYDAAGDTKALDQLKELLERLGAEDLDRYPDVDRINNLLSKRDKRKVRIWPGKSIVFEELPANGIFDHLGATRRARNIENVEEYFVAAQQAMVNPESAIRYKDLFVHPVKFESAAEILKLLEELRGKERKLAIALVVLSHADDTLLIIDLLEGLSSDCVSALLALNKS